LKNSLLECNVCVLQTYVFQQKNSDIYADGWKWQSRGRNAITTRMLAIGVSIPNLTVARLEQF